MTLVIAQRQRLIDEVDIKSVDEDVTEDLVKPDPDPDPEDGDVPQLPGPSMEAMSKLTDYSKDISSGVSGGKYLIWFCLSFDDSGTLYQR